VPTRLPDRSFGNSQTKDTSKVGLPHFLGQINAPVGKHEAILPNRWPVCCRKVAQAAILDEKRLQDVMKALGAKTVGLRGPSFDELSERRWWLWRSRHPSASSSHPMLSLSKHGW
jgi:hypothetical protein